MENVTITTSEEFDRQAMKLAKKYRSFADDFADFLDKMTANPFQGVLIHENVRKVRMAITSKGKGKSGGARVITYSVNKIGDADIQVTLFAIFDKQEMENISDAFIRMIKLQEDERWKGETD